MHTAFLAILEIPLGIVIEKSNDSTLPCLKRFLTYLFRNSDTNGVLNICGALIASYRRYLTPSLVFLILMVAGADIFGSVKHILCWSFTCFASVRKNILKIPYKL